MNSGGPSQDLGPATGTGSSNAGIRGVVATDEASSRMELRCGNSVAANIKS